MVIVPPRSTPDSSIGRCRIAAYVGALLRRPIRRDGRRLSSLEAAG